MSLSFLCHFDGEHGAASAKDWSGNSHTITFNGSASLDGGYKKLGRSALALNGASGTYTTITPHADFDFGWGDVTLEAFIRPFSVTGQKTIMASVIDSNNYWSLYLFDSSLRFMLVSGGATVVNAISGGALSAGAWSHVAMTRYGSTWRLFVNGTQVASTQGYGAFPALSSTPLEIGRQNLSGGVNYFSGQIDEVRILKGQAAWTETFTPPAEPYTPPYLPAGQISLDYNLHQFIAGQADLRYQNAVFVAGQVNLPYSVKVAAQAALPFNVRVGGQIAVIYSHRLAGQVETPYTGLVFIAGQIAINYDLRLTNPAAGQVEMPYLIRVGGQESMPYALMDIVAGQVEMPFTATVSVAGQRAMPYNIKSTNGVMSAIKLLYAMSASQTFHRTDAPKIIFKGKTVRLVTFSVRASEGAFAWTLTATLADPVDFSAMRVDDPFTLDIYGEQYAFIIDSKSVNRGGPANIQLQVSGISPTAVMALPRADKITKTWGQVMARDAAEEALGDIIDWLISNWSVQESRLAVTDAAPVDVAGQIIKAAGGVLETKKDGSWLARPAYPVTVPDWPSATPDHILTDEVDNLSASELYQQRDRFNAVTIRDFDSGQGAYQDRTEYEADKDDPLKGVLRVYAWPWRPIEVAHTGHPAVGLAPQGMKYVSKRELVEFIAGKASVQYPVYSLISIQWQYADLGSVSASGADLLASGGDGYSMAWVEYQARAYVFNVSDTREETIQFLVMDNEI